MILFPNAKINIGLDILRRRPDGYHDVATVMYPVDWCDVLEIVPAAGTETTLRVSGRHVDCPVEKNLVMKAYRALREIVPELPEADIYLRKVVPDGAGLGGGSSDAAFTLKGLNRLFGLGLTDEKLAGVAAGIGADCPFFIYNRPMLCTGTGTEMTPVEVPHMRGLTLALVKPPVSVGTREAYAGVSPRVPATPLECEMPVFPYGNSLSRVRNAFEPSVFAVAPEIGVLKARLQDMPGLPRPVYVAMSGSGSSVYALYDSGRCLTADKLADVMRGAFAGCEVHCQTLR